MGTMNNEGSPFSYHDFVANVYKSSSLFHTNISWIMDSGATDHIFSNRDLFSSFQSLIQPHYIGLPDGHHAIVSFVGDIHLHDSIVLHGVLYVPSFKYNLLSIPKFTRQLHTFVIFTDEHRLMQGPSSKNDLPLGVFGNKINDLYVFDHRTIKTSLSFCSLVFPYVSSFNVINKSSNTLLWHRRLGHVPLNKLRQLSLISSQCNDFTFDSCITCSQAKKTRLSFPKSQSSSHQSFDLIHIDVWGPYKHCTHDGFKYFLTIVDDFTRHTWLHLLANKSSAFSLIKAFVTLIQNQFKKTVKIIRTDDACELGSSNEGVQYFQSKGIIHQKSTPYCPQQNGLVERKHRHILEVAIALFFQSGLGHAYWGECVKTVVHLINRMPTKNLQHKTPFEALHNEVPDLTYLKSFGCLCFVSSQKSGRDKFMPHTHPCVFIGYPTPMLKKLTKSLI